MRVKEVSDWRTYRLSLASVLVKSLTFAMLPSPSMRHWDNMKWHKWSGQQKQNAKIWGDWCTDFQIMLLLWTAQSNRSIARWLKVFSRKLAVVNTTFIVRLLFSGRTSTALYSGLKWHGCGQSMIVDFAMTATWRDSPPTTTAIMNTWLAIAVFKKKETILSILTNVVKVQV